MNFKPLLLKTVLGGLVAFWAGLSVVIQTLLVLMALDITTGLLAAWVSKTVARTVAFRGMCRKAGALCVVGAAHVVSRGLGAAYSLQADLGTWVAAGFCIHELLSIVENAARAGVTIPGPLMRALEKLKSKEPSTPAS